VAAGVSGAAHAALVSAPTGVLAAILPSTAPHVTALTRLIPALVAGCSVLLKPAPRTPLSTLALAELFLEAGLPPGVLSILPTGRATADYLVAHPGVDAVSFSGSTAAAHRVSAAARGRLRPVSTDTVGRRVTIVRPDIDAVAAARAAASELGCAAGGSSIRLIVSRDSQEEVLQVLAGCVPRLRIGDPADPTTDIGPVVSRSRQAASCAAIRTATGEGTTRGGRPGPAGVAARAGRRVLTQRSSGRTLPGRLSR